jgi:4-carboxymuconolactone decarboxylase
MKILVTSIIAALALGTLPEKAFAQATTEAEYLTAQQQGLVSIAAYTANGDLKNLSQALTVGLEAGLTINEIKEAIVHTYAYCGFPRSIRGLQTFMTVLSERKAKGREDKPGKEVTPITNTDGKYERGKKILSELTGASQDGALTGYGAFAPVIDTFLKEHLFADIFERDVLTYAQRELVTISVLSSMGGVEPMLRSHLSICLNIGFTPQQLNHFVVAIEPTVGKEKTEAAKAIVIEVLKNQRK